MQFNSEANSLDLVSDIKFWCGIDSSDSTSYPLTAMARNSNFALDRYNALAIRADGNWEFDDANNSSTELLDVTTAIVSGTRKYAVGATWLTIARVRIKDSNGQWHVVEPASRRTWSTSQLNAEAGVPTEYDLLGNWIYFDRAPNWSQSASLEVQFQRGPSYFASTDTTKTPGFAAQFHRLISMRAALDYCEVNDLDNRAAKLRDKLGAPPTDGFPGAGMELEFFNFYATRNVDDRPTITVTQEDYGQLGGANASPMGF